MEFHFRQHFRLRPKMRNAFRSVSSIYHKKVLVLVLKKSLDYITGIYPCVLYMLVNKRVHYNLGFATVQADTSRKTT